MEDDVERAVNYCVNQVPNQVKTIVVNQIVGQNSTQKSMDIQVVVPRRKPAIEQIVDVFVKRLRINHVEIITDKVIVRGSFEVKAIYVACLPNQPVHAVEVQNVRFTADVPIRGARRGMDADASAAVEFVDYDCDKRSRAYWYKEYEKQFRYRYSNYDEDYDDCDDDDDHYEKKYHKHYKKYGKPKYDPACCDPYDPCEPCDPCGEPCEPEPCKPVKKPCKHYIPCEPCVPYKKKCSRRFNVAVVLRITAKVMCDRPIVLYPGQPSLPLQPKG